MESTRGTDEEFRKLDIIFYALIMGQLLFAIVVVYLIFSGPLVMQQAAPLLGEQTDLMLVAAYALGMIFMSRFMNSTRSKSISAARKSGLNLFGHYRSTVIIRLALLEGAALFIIVLTLVTANPQLLLLLLPLWYAFYISRPSKEEFREAYDVSA